MKANYLRDEKGVALVVALVILLVLTVIGFVAISTSTFEANIVGNERIGTDAFYAAEAIVEMAYDQIPDITEIPKTGEGEDNRLRVGATSFGWTGTASDKGNQKPITHKGLHTMPGYDSSFAFSRFSIQAAGESVGASREMDSLVSYGPFPAGTSYNN